MMHPFKVLIVDDELASQNLLSTIITNYCPQFSVVGSAGDLPSAISKYNTLCPDVLCMDYDLGNITGFDILDLLNIGKCVLILTTAFEEHALKAFKYQASDYWLKPYTPKDIVSALQRLVPILEERRLVSKWTGNELKSTTSREDAKFCVHTSDGISVYQISNIVRLEGEGAYCQIYLRDGTSNLLSKNLKEVYSALPGELFFRVHDSHVINLNFVKEFKKEDGGFIVLSNNDRLPVSRRKKQEFVDRLVRLQA
ncbi:MAG: response regulator transcription factor [Saprospiraceae bacterium]|nr:response regulator transcription factor [Saprospiraceae bacterium]